MAAWSTCASAPSAAVCAMRAEVSTGARIAAAGQSHSWLRPTSRSPAPAAKSNSVADGSRLTTRMAQTIVRAAAPGHSTVTLLARLRGLSTSLPRSTAA